MKRELIIELISAINEEHISATLESIERQKTRRKQLSMTLATAACACLVVGAFFVGAHFASKPAPVTPPVPGTGTSTYTETDPATEPTPVIPDDFVIEDGVLLSYNGADTDVVVPEEVRTITATSFTTGNTGIRTISLGRNVSKIDETAFMNLQSLEKIEVDERNPFYTEKDGYLSRRDGTLFFAPFDSLNDVSSLFDTLKVMQENYEQYTELEKIVIGKVSFEVIYDPSNGGYDYNSHWKYTSITAFGQTETFINPVPFYTGGDGGLNTMFQTDDTFVYGSAYFGNRGIFTVYTESGIYLLSSEIFAEENTADYNLSKLMLIPRDDGKLGYERRPEKYCMSDHVMELYHVVSRDEFAKETGYVDFDNGEVKLFPEKTYTAGEEFDLDKIYDSIKKAKDMEGYSPIYVDGIENIYGVPIFDTLDELLAYNAERNERVYP